MAKGTSCIECKHYNVKKWGTCKAFPKSIPFVINSGAINHDKPLSIQQNDIVFEFKEKD